MSGGYIACTAIWNEELRHLSGSSHDNYSSIFIRSKYTIYISIRKHFKQFFSLSALAFYNENMTEKTYIARAINEWDTMPHPSHVRDVKVWFDKFMILVLRRKQIFERDFPLAFNKNLLFLRFLLIYFWHAMWNASTKNPIGGIIRI